MAGAARRRGRSRTHDIPDMNTEGAAGPSVRNTRSTPTASEALFEDVVVENQPGSAVHPLAIAEQPTPSQRQATPAPAPSDMSQATPDEEEERLEKEYSRLKTQIIRKRRLEQIASMRAELEGKAEVEPIAFDGEPLPIRKRRVTTPTDEPITKYMKMAPPPTFGGKSMRELNKYITGWSIHLKALPREVGDSQAEHVRLAVIYLTDTAAQA